MINQNLNFLKITIKPILKKIMMNPNFKFQKLWKVDKLKKMKLNWLI